MKQSRVRRNKYCKKTKKAKKLTTRTKTKEKTKSNKINILNGGSMKVAHIQLPEVLTKKYLMENPNYCYELYDLAIKLVRENNYIFVLELLQKWFQKSDSDETTKKLFNPYHTLPIPFITEVQNSINFTTDFYYKWYMSKNPELKVLITETEVLTPIDTNCTITTSNGEKTFPIYETLLAQICRDICILLVKQHFFEDDILESPGGRIANKRNTPQIANTDKFNALLKKCNDCIKSNYNYLLVCQICDEFIVSMSLSPEYKRNYLFNNKFIFFPTTIQISYQSMILLITSPIINFRLNNRMRETHTKLEYPSHDFNHNVADHAVSSHILDGFIKNKILQRNFQPWFENISNFVKILSKYFFIPPKDKQKDTKYTTENIVEDKTMYSFVLFTLLHEFINFCFLILMPVIVKNNKKIPPVSQPISQPILQQFKMNLNMVAGSDRLTSVIKIFNGEPSTIFKLAGQFNNVIAYFIDTIIIEVINEQTGSLFIKNIEFLYNTLLLYYKAYNKFYLKAIVKFNEDLREHINN